MSEHHSDQNVHVHLHFHGLEGIIAALTDRHSLVAVLHALQELKQMSQSLSVQLDAGLAAIGTALDALSTDITSIAAEVTTLVAGLTPGSAVTQQQVDQANALASRVSGLDTAAKAIVAQAPGTSTHVALDTTDQTPNGQARADGTTRNNFSLPDFDPNQPETT